MRKLENKEKIANIYFERSISPFCPLGKDYYSAEIQVSFDPNLYYMDYIELDEEIQKLGGKSLTIEQLAQAVYDLVNQFEPTFLDVTIDAKSNKHFPVTVRKTSFDD